MFLANNLGYMGLRIVCFPTRKQNVCNTTCDVLYLGASDYEAYKLTTASLTGNTYEKHGGWNVFSFLDTPVLRNKTGVENDVQTTKQQCPPQSPPDS